MKNKLSALVCMLSLAPMLAGHHPSGSGMGHSVQVRMEDGPYVNYARDSIHVRYVHMREGVPVLGHDSLHQRDKGGLILTVNTDIPGTTFKVRLKGRLGPEKSEYRKAERQLVISDIEGNFGAFRKLLQAAGVINDRFEWTFGDGHLILAGDFFDRGSQVTEVLWLCYALEEMAGKAGGYVHFILGNHEIMNLSADYRYLHPKYPETAAIMKVDLRALYGDDTELGRWLRTKNVMEKVGRNLYLHGGVSRLVNNVDWDLPAINAKARPFYADTVFAYPDLKTELLFSDLGPFWYRGYYMGDLGQIPGMLDSTLGKFRVDRVVTGHTPVADTVSGWYGGKLFNVDTPHRSGKSQAMLLEGGRIYIIDAAGGKMPFKG